MDKKDLRKSTEEASELFDKIPRQFKKENHMPACTNLDAHQTHLKMVLLLASTVQIVCRDEDMLKNSGVVGKQVCIVNRVFISNMEIVIWWVADANYTMKDQRRGNSVQSNEFIFFSVFSVSEDQATSSYRDFEHSCK